MSKHEHKGYCYLNGKYIPIDKATISPLDSGFMRGYCVTDFLRTYNKEVFMFDEHFKRFSEGAKILGLKLNISKKEMLKVVNMVLKKNSKDVKGDFKIKMLLSGGIGEHDLAISNDTTLFVYAGPIATYPVSMYEKGTKLITHRYHRHLPEAKTSHYIEAIRQQENIKKAGAIEVLYTGKAHVYECSTSNFFIFKKGKLISNEEGILQGITKLVMLKAAKKLFPIENRLITIKELKDADEAFITSTTKEVMPVVKIDNIRIGNGKVGPNTRQLMMEFKRYVK
jgi:branched-subunit amino acid aminotransferase/4-amino-4-deoxychorismate lyase